MKQVKVLHEDFDQLQRTYGDSSLNAIYGVGCVENPDVCFVFMNPTARNIASSKEWRGLRAPWIGTKAVWSLFSDIGRFSKTLLNEIRLKKIVEWNSELPEKVYQEIAKNSLYITNLSKATQLDARPLSNKIFKEYLKLFGDEMGIIKPCLIIAFGNQVSSLIFGKNIKMSEMHGKLFEKNDFKIGVTYYPVGQGRRNMPIAIKDIKKFIEELL